MRKYIDTVFKRLALFLVGTLIAGCAQVSQQIPGLSLVPETGGEKQTQHDLTAAEQRLRGQGRDLNQSFQNEVISGIDKTILEGALAGAGLGVGIGAIAGGDSGKIWKMAVASGAVGVIAGAYVSSQEKKFAKTEDLLDDTIQKVRNRNQETEGYIATAQEVLDENKQTLANLDGKYSKGSVTLEELKAKHETVRSNGEEVTAAIKESRNQLEFYQKTLDKIKSGDPEVDVQSLAQEIDRNVSNIEALESIDEELNTLGRM